MVNLAGGGTRFAYNAGHAPYIHDAFNGGSGLYDSATDTASCPPKPGDLVCAGRLATAGWTFENFETWAEGTYGFISSHCDVVTEVTGDTTDYSVKTIGGNLGDTVKRNTYTKATFQSAYAVRLRLGGRKGQLDIVFCTDISGSFSDDIANFRAQVPIIICGRFARADGSFATAVCLGCERHDVVHSPFSLFRRNGMNRPPGF